MVDVWFTSDFHFGHANIIRYCDRPFSSVAEMDEAILDRLNSCVKTTDHLYFLGDFCIGGPVAAASYRERIRSKKIQFTLGNHDKAIKKIADQFVWVKEIAEVNVQNQPIVLCHYAMRVWNRSHHGAWHLYGHSHSKLPAAEGSQSMDVCVDTNAFHPYHLDEIRTRLALIDNNESMAR